MIQPGLRNILLGGVLSAALVLTGCGRGMVAAENPTPVEQERYEPLFDATVQTLRDMGFTVDRRDRRFGVITTKPRTSPSVFEPWFGDNTTGEQVLASTLNHRRRIIRVEIQPRGNGEQAAEKETGGEVPPSAAEAEGPEGADANRAGRGDYQLHAIVDVQRRIVPTAELTTAAVRSITLRDRRAPRRVRVTERGPAETFWQGIGRDPHLERHLVHAILQRAGPAERAAEADEAAGREGEDS